MLRTCLTNLIGFGSGSEGMVTANKQCRMNVHERQPKMRKATKQMFAMGANGQYERGKKWQKFVCIFKTKSLEKLKAAKKRLQRLR